MRIAAFLCFAQAVPPRSLKSRTGLSSCTTKNGSGNHCPIESPYLTFAQALHSQDIHIPEAMAQPFNSYGYPGYMQGSYPMVSFPSGQPGTAPMPYQPSPLPSGMSQPVQAPAPAPQAPTPVSQATAEVGHISPPSSDAGDATSAFKPVAPMHSIEHDDHHEEEHIPFFAPFGKGFIGDLKEKLPWYFSDIKDGFNLKVIITVLYLFWGVIANAVAFGSLLGDNTD
eukprot:3935915-Rhodomonas_salina.1